VLEAMQTKARAGEAIAIPAAVVEHAAQIERVSIARERRDAVVASAATTDHGYGILVARDVCCAPEHALYPGALVFRAFARCVHGESECIVHVKHKQHTIWRVPYIRWFGEWDASGAASRFDLPDRDKRHVAHRN
jgi:hypothetical protein